MELILCAESLTEASMEFAAYKVLFLVVLSSAKRISELHALCIDPSFLLERAHSFNLVVNPAFLLKTSSDEALSADIELQAFHPDPTSHLDLLFQRMCLVRTLKIYLDSYQTD